MKKVFFLIFFLSLSLVPPRPVWAQWELNDWGIQKPWTSQIPQITNSGKIQYSYTNESFFPLALYHVDLGPVPDANGVPQGQAWNAFKLNSATSWNTLPEVAAAGFNTIYTMGNIFPNNDEFALINQYGLKVFPNVAGFVSIGEQQNNWQPLIDMVKTNKDQPALLAWHLFDETAIASNQNLKKAYDLIHTNDPNNHAVFANGAGGGCQWDFISDFLNFDTYVIQNSTTPLYEVGRAVDRDVNCLQQSGSGLKKPVLLFFRPSEVRFRRLCPPPSRFGGRCTRRLPTEPPVFGSLSKTPPGFMAPAWPESAPK